MLHLRRPRPELIHNSKTLQPPGLPLHFARLLERPQGAQRRLLCLGHSPDAGDIESLVGSIPPQGEMVGDGHCFLELILLYL